MQMETAASLSIIERYRARTPKSGTLYERARTAFPSGLTHDSRVLDPYPLFVDHAAGSRKWYVDGHEYVDYFGGHGALLLGHYPPDVVAAVSGPGHARATSAPRTSSEALGRAHPRVGSLRPERTLHLLRPRGHASGIAPRARLHRP